MGWETIKRPCGCIFHDEAKLFKPFSGNKKIAIPKDDYFLATRNGLEPSTSSVTGWRANRLHHRARTEKIIAWIAGFVKGFFAFFPFP